MPPELTARQKWLAERKNGIGGSDIGALFNLDYGCSRALAYDKTNVSEDFPESFEKERDEFERGNIMEPAIRELYKKRTGRPAVIPESLIMRHAHQSWMQVSMDAITTDARKPGNGYAEFKCVNRFVMKQFEREGVRRSYILQMQHGLFVSGYTWGSFGILCLDPWEFHYFDVDADDELQAMLVEQEALFWESIKKVLPPELEDPRDKRCQSCRWRRTCRGSDFSSAPMGEEGQQGGSIIHAPELLPLVAEWVDLDQLAKAAEAQIEPIKETLRTAIGNNYGLTVPGAKVLYPKWAEERWETKQLNRLLPMLIKVAETDEWIFEKSFDELLTDALGYIRLIAMVVKSRKTSPKSSIRYYPSGD